MKPFTQILCLTAIALLSQACSTQNVITPVYYPDIQSSQSRIADVAPKSLYLTLHDMRELPANVIGYETPPLKAEKRAILLSPNVGRTVRDAFETLLISRGHDIGTLDGVLDITIERFDLTKADNGLSVDTTAQIQLSLIVKDPTGRPLSTLAFSANASNTHVKSFESTKQRLIVDVLNAVMQKIDQSPEFAAALSKL